MRPRDPAHRLALLFGAWVLTRVCVLVVTRARELYPYRDDPFHMAAFEQWGAAFAGAEGAQVPLRDGPWEYPAGAVPVVLLPALLRGAPYVPGFVGQMVLWDAAVLLVVALVGLRRGSLTGAWLWVAVVPLLGPVALTRYDVVPTFFAVAGLAAPPLLAGVLLGTGAVVKLWPALLVPLLLLLPGRGRVVAGSVAVGLATLAAVAYAGALPQVLSFLTYQRDRGLEIESLPALPLMLAHALGDERMVVGFGFGSYQVDGPWAPAMLAVGNVGMAAVLVLVGVLAVRARSRAAVLPLAVLLMSGVLVFDKVLSAQYPVWLAGLLALALCTPGSRLRWAVLPMCGLLLLTQLVYPLAILELVQGELQPVLLLAARDALLLVVAGIAAWDCWAAGPRRAASEDEVPVHEQHREQAEARR